MCPASSWRIVASSRRAGRVNEATRVEYHLRRAKTDFPGKDRHVRSVEIEYKNLSEKVFRTTT